jgi:hypothetical protein
MDEIDEAMREDDQRKTALQLAIAYRATVDTPISPQDTVSIAEVFYPFLKGETK